MNQLFDFSSFFIRFWSKKIFIVAVIAVVIVIGTLVLLSHFFDLQFQFLFALSIDPWRGKGLSKI